MDVGPLLVPHSEATILMPPAQGPLHEPAVYSQAATILGVLLGQQRLGFPLAEALPVTLRVVSPITQ